MIALAFALPQESRGVVAALHAPHRSGSPALPVIFGKLGTQEVVVFHTGVGPLSTRKQLQRFWETHCGERVDCVISAGFAGGLDPTLPTGALILAENFPERLEIARATLGNRVRVHPLASAPVVLETPQAKAQYKSATRAFAVDMESATIADFFHKKGVPFLSLRAISDAAHEALPIPSAIWFDVHTQRPRPLALILFLVRHPARILPFSRFILTLRRARRTLTAALIELVALTPPGMATCSAATGPAPQRQ